MKHKECRIPFILNAYARLCNEPVSLSVSCKVKHFVMTRLHLLYDLNLRTIAVMTYYPEKHKSK